MIRIKSIPFIGILCLLAAPMVQAQQLSLDSCLALAKQNNYTLRQANNDVRRAKEVQNQALTKYFPQVSANAVGYAALHPLLEVGIDGIDHAGVRDVLNTFYQTYGAALGLQNPYPIINQYGALTGASVVQPVYMGGKIVAGNKLAKVGVMAAELQQEVAERDKLLQVEECYWLCVSLQEKQQTLTDMQILLDTLAHVVSTAVEAGVTMNNDLMRVQLKQDETTAQALQLSNGIMLVKMALCQSIGIAYSDSITLVDTLSLHMQERMVHNPDSTFTRPEEQLLALNVRAEQLRKRMTVADALPKVMLGASYGYTNAILDKNKHNGIAGVVVRVPLTDWWETAHKIKEHNIVIENAKWQQQDLTEQMQLQTKQAWTAVVEAQSLVTQYQQSVRTAEENYRLALLGYETGMQPISDLLEAQTLLSNARNDLTDACIK